ncbi:MAG: deaminase [Patescibacteria group bacterium]
METKNIKYPYLPQDRIFLYVPENNEYMSAAREVAEISSTDKKISTGAVIVNGEGKIIIGASNQSALKNKFLLDTHKNWCIRKLFKVPSGQKYWLCPGCASSKYHAEARAVTKSKKFHINISGCDLYLWGHWWCCQPCWNKMIRAGIKNVYLTSNN